MCDLSKSDLNLKTFVGLSKKKGSTFPQIEPEMMFEGRTATAFLPPRVGLRAGMNIVKGDQREGERPSSKDLEPE